MIRRGLLCGYGDNGKIVCDSSAQTNGFVIDSKAGQTIMIDLTVARDLTKANSSDPDDIYNYIQITFDDYSTFLFIENSITSSVIFEYGVNPIASVTSEIKAGQHLKLRLDVKEDSYGKFATMNCYVDSTKVGESLDINITNTVMYNKHSSIGNVKVTLFNT